MMSSMLFCREAKLMLGSVCVSYLAPDRESVFNACVVVYKLACRPFASAKSLAWSTRFLIGYPL